MKSERAAILLLLLGMSGLAWYHAHRPAIWFDEGWSWWVARMPVVEALKAVARDRHPPLRPLLDHMWIRVAGETEFALRWPSGAFVLLTLALTWRMARCLGIGLAGRLAAIGMILASPLWIEQARQARMYTQMAFLALLSWWSMERWLRRPDSWRRWALWSLTSLALLLTHYYAVFFLAVAFWLLIRSPEREARWKALLGIGAWAVAIGGWIAFGGISPGLFLPQSQDLAEHPIQGLQTLIAALRSLMTACWPGLSPIEAACLMSLLIMGMRPVGEPVEARWRWLTFGSLAIALIETAGIRRNLLNFAPRHLLYLYPLIGIGIGRGVDILSRWDLLRQSRKPLVLWPFLSLLLLGPPYMHLFQGAVFQTLSRASMAGPDREIVFLLKTRGQPGDVAITVRGHYAIRYYGNREGLPMPLVDGPSSPVQDDEAVARWLKSLSSICVDHFRLWMIAWQEDIVDPFALFPRWLLWNGFEEEQREITGFHVYRYSIRCPIQRPPAPAPAFSVQFSPGIRLQGVQIRPPHSQDRILGVTMMWERIGPLRDPVKVFLHVHDPSGRLVAQEDIYLARGLHPIVQWPEGLPMAVFAGIRLPAAVAPGLYRVTLGLYHPGTMVRYPILSPIYGEDALPIATLDLQSALGSWQSLPVPSGAAWQDGLALSGAWVEPEGPVRRGERIRLLTAWVRAGLEGTGSSEPKVAFVHLWDESGHLIAQDDHPLPGTLDAGMGAGPWESIWDLFEIRIPETIPPGRYRLVVGRYEWPSLRRIPIGAGDHLELGFLEIFQ